VAAGSIEVVGTGTDVTLGVSRSGARPIPAHPAASSMQSTPPILATSMGTRSRAAFGGAGARFAVMRDDPQSAVKSSGR